LILGFTIRFAHRTKAEADTQKSHILKPKPKPKTKKNTDILTQFFVSGLKVPSPTNIHAPDRLLPLSHYLCANDPVGHPHRLAPASSVLSSYICTQDA
jgi:hypothetical protein